ISAIRVCLPKANIVFCPKYFPIQKLPKSHNQVPLPSVVRGNSLRKSPFFHLKQSGCRLPNSIRFPPFLSDASKHFAKHRELAAYNAMNKDLELCNNLDFQ